MLYITAHGFRGYQNDDYRVLFGRIRDRLAGAAYYNHVRVSCDESIVLDMQWKEDRASEAFLLLMGSREDSEKLHDIQKRLDDLDIQMRVAPIQTLYEKKSVRDAALERLKGLRPVAGTDANFDYEKGRLKDDSPEEIQARVDQCAENLKRDLGPYPVTKSRMLDNLD